MSTDQTTGYSRELELLKRMIAAHESEIDCDTCAEHMDCLADLTLADETPEGTLEAIQRHVECCRGCKNEFEALIAILRMEREQAAGKA
jgi:hypothetical protein